MLGRLRPGVTRDAARTELESVMTARLAQAHASPGPHLAIVPFVDYSVGPVRQVLVGAVRRRRRAAVDQLCERVGLDARARLRPAARSCDTARARRDRGRSRARMDRRDLLLALAGGALGLTSAQWIVRALVALAPSDVPGLGEIAIDPPVALFTAVVVIATALLCGLGPVRQAVSTNLVEAVNETGRATGSLHSRRLRSTLVAAQIGLSIVLLVASALIAAELPQPASTSTSGSRRWAW